MPRRVRQDRSPSSLFWDVRRFPIHTDFKRAMEFFSAIQTRKISTAVASRNATAVEILRVWIADRKSTRLNSSHVSISYAVFCLKQTLLRRTLRLGLSTAS